MPDFIFSDHGSICLLKPCTDEGREWLECNVGGETQWFGQALVIEHRYVNDIVEGVLGDGLVVA